MQPESQVLVREFTRRMKAALASAPNHVRVEAALEVESHVLDVLSRRRSEAPEPEQVARILSGFGTPEEYARALVTQLPEAEAATVRASSREILLAVRDLAGGSVRLLRAALHNVWAYAELVMRTLWRGARTAAVTVQRLARYARGPAGKALEWAARRGRDGARLLERSGRSGAMTFRKARTLANSGYQAAVAVVRFGGRAAVALLKFSGLALLGLLALGAFGLAAVAALVPDVLGFYVHEFNLQVHEITTEIRQHTVARYSSPMQVEFAHTGTVILQAAMATGLILTVLVIFLIWMARRNRSSTAN